MFIILSYLPHLLVVFEVMYLKLYPLLCSIMSVKWFNYVNLNVVILDGVDKSFEVIPFLLVVVVVVELIMT